MAKHGKSIAFPPSHMFVKSGLFSLETKRDNKRVDYFVIYFHWVEGMGRWIYGDRNKVASIREPYKDFSSLVVCRARKKSDRRKVNIFFLC